MSAISPTPTAKQILRNHGSSLAEAVYQAFPPHLVPERLTTAEQLAEAERRNQRDRRPATAELLRVEHQKSGSHGHARHAVTFHFADGTSQHFAPHTN